MDLFIDIATVFTLLSTFFMLFLTWLAKDSKDPFAKKLRILGWSGVAFGWGFIASFTLLGWFLF